MKTRTLHQSTTFPWLQPSATTPEQPATPFGGVPKADVELTVVIPAFNEALRLGKSLERIISYLHSSKRLYEILVVDDGSRDATSAVAKDFRSQGVRTIRLSANQGKGFAVRKGVLSSSGRHILICDADLSTPIEELSLLEAHLGHFDLVVGSREVDAANIRRPQPRMRKWLGRLFNLVARWAAVPGIRDTQCGFKLIKAEDARKLFSQLVTNGFAFDVELLWLARRSAISFTEVGVEWHDDRASKVKAWRDGPRMLLEIARFRLYHWRRSFRAAGGS